MKKVYINHCFKVGISRAAPPADDRGHNNIYEGQVLFSNRQWEVILVGRSPTFAFSPKREGRATPTKVIAMADNLS